MALTDYNNQPMEFGKPYTHINLGGVWVFEQDEYAPYRYRFRIQEEPVTQAWVMYAHIMWQGRTHIDREDLHYFIPSAGTE